MTAQLTVHNAQVTTATVEVKTLTMGRKQVTLAVFRQLYERGILDDDHNLLGQPWGVVNYHPDKYCAMAGGGHLHVVWQDGDQLYRCTAYPSSYGNPADIWCSPEDLQALYCSLGHGKTPSYAGSSSWNLDFTFGDQRGTITASEWRAHMQCLAEPERYKRLEWLAQQITSQQERKARFTASWNELRNLPQLFIAV